MWRRDNKNPGNPTPRNMWLCTHPDNKPECCLSVVLLLACKESMLRERGEPVDFLNLAVLWGIIVAGFLFDGNSQVKFE